MTATDGLVIVGALAAIVWVNWYFFFADRSAAGTTADGRRRGGGNGHDAPRA